MSATVQVGQWKLAGWTGSPGLAVSSWLAESSHLPSTPRCEAPQVPAQLLCLPQWALYPHELDV